MAIVFIETSFRRVLWASDGRGRYRGKDYLDDLAQSDQAKLLAAIRYLAQNPRIHNTTRFRKEKDGIFCFKCHKRRLACFIDGRDVVIVSGFDKKSDRDKRADRALDQAVRLRGEYLDAKD